jgi:inorganic pyrophosphatase
MKVFIEGEAGSKTRRRYDERTLEFREAFETRAARPYAYGFVPGTASGDEDALDVWVLPGIRLACGTGVECRLLDVFMFREGDETEAKLVATEAPDKERIEPEELARIEAFLVETFKAWPELEVSVGPLEGRERALSLLRERGLDG